MVCWTGDSVAGLDATSGEVYWRHPLKPRNMPIGIATPVMSFQLKLHISGDIEFKLSFKLCEIELDGPLFLY